MTPEKFSELMITVWKSLRDTSWHWFSYHFSQGPRPFAISIMEACANINERAEGVGTVLLRELLAIGGLERHEPHYEQLLQKLGEILIIERVVTSEWPASTTFEHEPAVIRGGPRPELLATFPDGRMVVEVKTPSMFKHIRQRAQNGTQLPYRDVLPLDQVRAAFGSEGVTLPRDYPVRDFLIDADRKFAGFRDGRTASLLVMIWDDYIYEPISMLVNPESGLLTPNSFERDDDGNARIYQNIDAIVAVRHMNYLIAGAREEAILDRSSAMDFGDARSLPNVSFDVSGIGRVPAHVLDRLRAVAHDDPALKRMAEYSVQDMVFWLPDRS